MSFKSNNPFAPTREEKREDRLDIDHDEKLTALTPEERHKIFRELADLIRNAKTGKELAALLDAQRILNIEPDKLVGNNSSGGQNDADKKVGPTREHSQEQTISETISGKFNELALAMKALSPNTLDEIGKAGRQAITAMEEGYAQMAAYSQISQGGTPGPNQNSPNQSRSSNDRDERHLLETRVADNARAESDQRLAKIRLKGEQDELAAYMQLAVAMTADPREATADTMVKMTGKARDSSKSQVEAAAANTKEAAREALTRAPDGDRYLAAQLAENTPAGAGTLVIGDISRAQGAQLSSQAVGKAPTSGLSLKA